jgi:hypothetical protein
MNRFGVIVFVIIPFYIVELMDLTKIFMLSNVVLGKRAIIPIESVFFFKKKIISLHFKKKKE